MLFLIVFLFTSLLFLLKNYKRKDISTYQKLRWNITISAGAAIVLQILSSAIASFSGFMERGMQPSPFDKDYPKSVAEKPETALNCDGRSIDKEINNKKWQIDLCSDNKTLFFSEKIENTIAPAFVVSLDDKSVKVGEVGLSDRPDRSAIQELGPDSIEEIIGEIISRQ